MEQKPLLLTEYALGRLLKEFAMNLGLSDLMADSTAQIFIQQSPSIQRWSEFMEKNCGNCRYHPESCWFFNPTSRTILTGSLTPLQVRAGTAISIETGTVRKCPGFTPGE